SLAAGDSAISCEVDGHATENLGVLPGLTDANGVAVPVAGHRRIRPRRSEAHALKVTEQGMRVPTDDHIHASQLRGHGLVILVALVRQQYDMFNIISPQFIDDTLRRTDLILEDS